MDIQLINENLKNINLKNNKGLFNSVCNDLYTILCTQLPFIFNENRKVNKLNFIKKSLRDGYVWDSYKIYDVFNEFNQ